MSIKSLLAATAILALLGGGVSYAQTPASTDKPATAAKSTAKPKKERSAKSIDCSKQADAKSLHGKERKKFRSQCMKG